MTREVETYILCLGEILIDFTSVGVSAAGVPLYEQNAGGAPANVACAISRLGSKSYFCGRVGQDMFGHYLKRVLQAEGVDPQFVVEDKDAPTTLAFVSLDNAGEREFSFVRNPGADTRLEDGDIPQDLLKQASVFHFGSLSLTHEPAAGALRRAVAFAKEHGVTTSMDVNLRPALWPDLRKAHTSISGILPLCDIVKMSYEELVFVIGGPEASAPHGDETAALAKCFLRDYPHALLLIITLGAGGSQLYFREQANCSCEHLHVAAHMVPVVDSTGAGDSYVAALLHVILQQHSLPEFLVSSTGVRRAAEFASAAAALCVTRRGAIAAMPYAGEVHELQSLSARNY